MNYFVMSVAISFLIVAIVLLSIQNSTMKRKLERCPAQSAFQVGDPMPKIPNYRTNHNGMFLADTLDFDNGFVFIYTLDCGHCRKSIPWLNILQASGAKVLGVAIGSFEEASTYAEINGVNYPFVSALNDKHFFDEYDLDGVPVLIQVDRGKIIDVYEGELNDAVINKYLP